MFLANTEHSVYGLNMKFIISILKYRSVFQVDFYEPLITPGHGPNHHFFIVFCFIFRLKINN